MKQSIDYMTAQVRGYHKICWKYFYPEAKDAAVASFARRHACPFTVSPSLCVKGKSMESKDVMFYLQSSFRMLGHL